MYMYSWIPFACTYTCTCKYTYTYTYTYTHIYIYVHIYIYMHTCVCMYTYTDADEDTRHTDTHVHISISHVHISISTILPQKYKRCVSVCVHKYKKYTHLRWLTQAKHFEMSWLSLSLHRRRCQHAEYRWYLPESPDWHMRRKPHQYQPRIRSPCTAIAHSFQDRWRTASSKLPCATHIYMHMHYVHM